MIYDRKNGQWYRVKRGFFGGLKLEPVACRNVRKFPTERDFIFEDGALKQFKRSPKPLTPE